MASVVFTDYFHVDLQANLYPVLATIVVIRNLNRYVIAML